MNSGAYIDWSSAGAARNVPAVAARSTTGQIFKIIPSSGEVDCDKAPCVGDLTGDGIVGAEDLASLLANWGPQPKGNDADLDGDGDVGPADLAIMLGAWGDCP